MIVFRKIEFILNGKIMGTVENSTLPAAIEAMKHLKPIENFRMNIACYYY